MSRGKRQPRTRDIANRAATDFFFNHNLVGFPFDAIFGCEPLSVTLENLSFVRIVQRRQFYLFL